MPSSSISGPAPNLPAAAMTTRASNGTSRCAAPTAASASCIRAISSSPPASAAFPLRRLARARRIRRHEGAFRRFRDAEHWRGRKALVLGTGTSGHDVAQELQAHGADVTIIQRSKTYVVSLKEAQSVYAIYSEGIPFDDCDLLATSFPYPVLQRSYQVSTARGREVDKALLDALGKTRLPPVGRRGRDRLPDDVSAPRRRLLLQRRLFRANHVRQNQAAAIFRHRPFRRRGRAAERRLLVPAELLVLATGYKNQQETVRALSRRRHRRQDRPGLGLRRGRRIAQHVAAHGAAGPLVHRRQPRAMPHLLALSGAADQGDGRRAVERARILWEVAR